MKLLRILQKLLKKLNSFQTTNTSNLAKKNDYDTELVRKITDHDHNDKYITTQEFNKVMSENFAAKLKQRKLGTKVDFDEFV